MRKVTFIIDDGKFLHDELKRQIPDITENKIADILSGTTSFKATLTLYGNEKTLDKYELTDNNGEKMRMSDLNGYQHGCIINDCYAYFEGRPYQNKSEKPCGVIHIIDEEIQE